MSNLIKFTTTLFNEELKLATLMFNIYQCDRPNVNFSKKSKNFLKKFFNLKRVKNQITIGTNIDYDDDYNIKSINIGLVINYPILYNIFKEIKCIFKEIKCIPISIVDGNIETYKSFNDLLDYFSKDFYISFFIPLSSIEKYSLEKGMVNDFLEFFYDFISHAIIYEYVFRYNYIYNNAYDEKIYIYEEIRTYKEMFDNIKKNINVDDWLKSILNNLPEKFKENIIINVNKLKDHMKI